MRALFLFLAQILGSIAASGLIVGLFPAAANVRTTLSKGLSIPKGLFIEAFLTAELVFTILMLAKEKHKATFIAPVGIGTSPPVSRLPSLLSSLVLSSLDCVLTQTKASPSSSPN